MALTAISVYHPKSSLIEWLEQLVVGFMVNQLSLAGE